MLLLLTGACIAVACFAAGVTAGPYLHRQRAAPAPPKTVKPVCGCTHHYAFHDAETRKCAGSVNIAVYPYPVKTAPCPCRNYCGPEPLPEYYAPEIANDGDSR